MKAKGKINLDIGCGENVQPGFIGMDKRDLPNVQVIHDAETVPWPFVENECSVLKMSHFIEHVKPWMQIDLLNECWRVLEAEGLLLISTPYGGSFRWHQDPTHCASWNEATPFYFEPGNNLYNVYKPKPWKIEKRYWDVYGDLEIAFRKVDERDNKI